MSSVSSSLSPIERTKASSRPVGLHGLSEPNRTCSAPNASTLSLAHGGGTEPEEKAVSIYIPEQLGSLSPEQKAAHVRGYDRRAAEAGEYLFEHLRCAVDWVGNADINSRVKDRYHAERAYLLIYREHPLVVREEALIVGVQLYSLYARVVQPVKLSKCTLPNGMRTLSPSREIAKSLTFFC